MSLISVDRAKYQKGSAGLNNGDAVALGLDGLTLDQVYLVGATFLTVSEDELRAKYINNNPGQQRMHIGNRLRKVVKAETFDFSYFASFTSELRETNEAAAAEAATAKAEAAAMKQAEKEAAKAEKAAAREAAKAEKEAAKEAAKVEVVETETKAAPKKNGKKAAA